MSVGPGSRPGQLPTGSDGVKLSLLTEQGELVSDKAKTFMISQWTDFGDRSVLSVHCIPNQEPIICHRL